MKVTTENKQRLFDAKHSLSRGENIALHISTEHRNYVIIGKSNRLRNCVICCESCP